MDFLGLLYSVGGAVSQGLLWAIMGLGVYISFRILDCPDMTVDGSFPLGAAVSAVLVIKMGWNPFLSLIVAVIAGMLAGLISGFLQTKLEIPSILAGILTMIALYSINIKVMGQPNIPFLGEATVVSLLQGMLPVSPELASAILGGVMAGLLVLLLYLFFGTELGSAVRSTGSNEKMSRALGVNTNQMKIFGLMLSNGLVALSGALVAQDQGYADVGMGTGTIVTGLASVIIGEVLLHRKQSFAVKLFSVVLGSVIYRIIIAFALRLGMPSTDLKMVTAIIVGLCLAVPVAMRKGGEQRRRWQEIHPIPQMKRELRKTKSRFLKEMAGAAEESSLPKQEIASIQKESEQKLLECQKNAEAELDGLAHPVKKTPLKGDTPLRRSDIRFQYEKQMAELESIRNEGMSQLEGTIC